MACPATRRKRTRPKRKTARVADPDAVMGTLDALGSFLICDLWPPERYVIGLRVNKTLRDWLSKFSETVILQTTALSCHHRKTLCTCCRCPRDLAKIGRQALEIRSANIQDLPIPWNMQPPWRPKNTHAVLDAVVLALEVGMCRGLKDLDLRSSGLRTHDQMVNLGTMLRKCQALRRLHLGSNYFGMGWAHALGVALRYGKNLTSLDLSCNDLQFGMNSLSQGLVHCTNLTDLNLDNNGIGEDGAEAISRVVSACTSLTSLSLSKNRVYGGMRKLTTALILCHDLAFLDLSCNKIGRQGAKVLAKALPRLSKLTALNVSTNPFGEDGMNRIADSLLQCPNLTELGLRACHLGDRVAHPVADLVMQRSSSLRALDLRRAQGLDEDDKEVLAAAVRCSTSLARLALCNLRRPLQGPRCFTVVLETLRLLAVLDLSKSGMHIGDVPHAARALWSCSHLRHLVMHPADVGSVRGLEVESSLGGLLRRNTRLEQLELRHCFIGLGPHTKHFFAALGNCRRLRVLDLAGNRIHGNQRLNFETALSRLPHLVRLDMSDNEEYGGDEKRRDGLRGCSKLEMLQLRGCGLQAEGVLQMMKAMSGCKRLRLLDMRDNYFGESMEPGEEEEEAVEAMEQLVHLTAMEHLLLGFNDLMDGAVEEIALATKRMPFLRHVDIEAGSFSEEAATSLAQSLRGLLDVHSINIRGTDMSDDGIVHLRDVLEPRNIIVHY